MKFLEFLDFIFDNIGWICFSLFFLRVWVDTISPYSEDPKDPKDPK